MWGGVASRTVMVLCWVVVVVFSLLQVIVACFIPVLEFVMRLYACFVVSKSADVVWFSMVRLQVLAG